MARGLAGGLALLLGTVIVLGSFAIAYISMTRPGLALPWPLNVDLLYTIKALTGMDFSRYVGPEIRALLNAGFLALLLLIAQGIGYGLLYLGSKALTPASQGL